MIAQRLALRTTLTWLVLALCALTTLVSLTAAARAAQRAPRSASHAASTAQVGAPTIGRPSTRGPSAARRAASTALTGLGRAQRSEHGRPFLADPRGSNLGERVITRTGTAEVTSLTPITGAPVSVFNLEIGGSHQYFVHETEVLAHNTYGFPRKSLQGVSLKWLQKINKPSGWKSVPTAKNEGWIWKDPNGVERLRFMRRTGNNPAGNSWSRQANGYFRWQN